MNTGLYADNHKKVLWGLLVILLISIAFLSINRQFNHDEFESVHSAWKIIHGERIYIDFFQHHHPFFYYLLVPFIKALGETSFTIVCMRILMLSMLLLIFTVTFLIAKKVGGKEIGIIALILLSSTSIFIRNAIEIRPDVPQTLLSLMAVLFLLNFYESNSLKDLALSAFFLGLSFLFLQKAVFLVLLISALLFFEGFKKPVRLNGFVLYLFVFVLTISPYYFYLGSIDSLQQYWFFNWVINFKWIKHFYPFYYMKETLLQNGLFWAFWILGILFFSKTLQQKRIAIISLALLFSVFFVRVPFRQYYMAAIPFAAIISALAINAIFHNSKSMLIALLVLSILYPLYKSVSSALGLTNHRQLQKIDYVLSLTDSKDFVYDADIQFNVFRKDPDFFWFSIQENLRGMEGLATYKALTNYDYDISRVIECYKPKVVSGYFIDNLKNGKISNKYIRSVKYNDLFIRTN